MQRLIADGAHRLPQVRVIECTTAVPPEVQYARKPVFPQPRKDDDKEGGAGDDAKPPQDVDGKRNPALEYVYRVEVVTGPHQGQVLTIKASHLSREKHALSKRMLMRWLRVNSTRAPRAQAPLVLSDELIERFHLPRVPEGGAENREGGGGEDGEDDESATVGKKRRRHVEADDGEIPHEGVHADARRPLGQIEKRSVWGDLLAIWHFLTTFSKVIRLSPFPMEDLEAALQRREATTLLVEIFRSLLEIVMKDQPAIGASVIVVVCPCPVFDDMP